MTPSAQTRAIIEAICVAFSPIMITCVVNQHRGYWLLSNDFATTIKLYVKLTKEIL